MKISTLTIEMAANVARLRQDMDRAQKTVDKAMGGISKAANVAAGALAALGIGLSISAITGWVRGAINAADQMTKMAQRTGLAVTEVAGLQLAFRQSGVEATQFVPIMAKLSNAAVNGSEALKAMGVESRNNDGTLKSTRELIGEVADKFAGYQDGAAKTAIAVKLFGEEGAKILPLLNQGASGLENYDEMARRLGLTLDKETGQQAERFNDTLDLIGQSTQGVARQLAAQLLPTLTGLAGQFFNSMTSGDRLKNTAEFLATTMKGLYVVALGVVEVFSTVGRTLGGVAAAVVAAATGDFRMAGNILKDLKSDIGTGWKTTLAEMQGAWSASGDAGVTAMAAITKAAPPAIEATKKLGNETKKMADEAKRAAEEYKALYEQEMRQLKAAEELYGEKMKLARELREYEEAQLKAKAEIEKKAAKEAQDAIDKQIKAEQDAYVDMWRSVDETARDVFVSVADEGMDAFERIGKTLKAAILDMLYQMTVRKWIFQIAGVDAGGMGGGGGGGNNLSSMYSAYSNFSAGGGGNMGAAYGWATGGMSTANALGSVYANTMTAGMSTGSIASSGAGIDALLATNGAYGTAQAGAASGVASGLAAVPVWGWIALAVMALWEPMFGSKLKEQGKAGNFDGAGGIATSQYTHRQGGWFSSNKTMYEPLNDGDAFQRQLKGVQDGMIETARVMGLGEDAIRNFSGSINIDLLGLNPQEAAAKTKEEMTKLQAQMLATASFVPQVVQSFEQIEQAALEMGHTAEQAAAHAREVTSRDDAMKRQGFEQMTNYYIGLINQTEEVMAQAGITSQALADVITAGMTGRLDQSQVGAQLADIIIGGIYNTIAGGFAQQISNVFMQQIIQPIMMAVTAGVPITAAVSQQAIQTVVATAQNAAAQLSAIFSDPAFRSALDGIQQAIGGISAAVVKPARHVRSFGTAALSVGKATQQAADDQKRLAEEIKRQWMSITNTIIDEIRRIRGEVLGMGPDGVANLQAQFALNTARARAGSQDAAELLPGLSRDLIELARETSTSLSDFRAVQGSTLASLEATAKFLASRYKFKLPSFDVGTNFVPQDMVAQVHRGEAIVPARYNPANGGEGNKELVAEVKALKAANVAMAATMNRLEQGMSRVTAGYNVMRNQEVTV